MKMPKPHFLLVADRVNYIGFSASRCAMGYHRPESKIDAHRYYRYSPRYH